MKARRAGRALKEMIIDRELWARSGGATLAKAGSKVFIKLTAGGEATATILERDEGASARSQ